MNMPYYIRYNYHICEYNSHIFEYLSEVDFSNDPGIDSGRISIAAPFPARGPRRQTRPDQRRLPADKVHGRSDAPHLQTGPRALLHRIDAFVAGRRICHKAACP